MTQRGNLQAFKAKRWKRPPGAKHVKAYTQYRAVWSLFKLSNGAYVHVGHNGQCVVRLVAGSYIIAINGKQDTRHFASLILAISVCVSIMKNRLNNKKAARAVTAKAITAMTVTAEAVTGKTATQVIVDDPYAQHRRKITNVIPLFRTKRTP